MLNWPSAVTISTENIHLNDIKRKINQISLWFLSNPNIFYTLFVIKKIKLTAFATAYTIIDNINKTKNCSELAYYTPFSIRMLSMDKWGRFDSVAYEQDFYFLRLIVWVVRQTRQEDSNLWSEA